ncbi:MAG: 4-alpha-glucanotransferase, partial [bacterium]
MAFDLTRRSSGVLLHLSSLPGPLGQGDLGPSAHAFASWLARAGQGWWQMLPIGPSGAAGSPYQSPSAFAGDPLFISLERLAEDGWLDPVDLPPEGSGP